MPKMRIVKRPILTDLNAFLAYFFNTQDQIAQAEKILSILKKQKEVHESKWRVFLTQSVGLYTKVMRALRDFGLVEKRDGYFRLSREFLYATKKMREYWEDFTL